MDLGRWQRVAYHYENELGQSVIDSGRNGPDRFAAFYVDAESRMVFVSAHPRLDLAFIALAESREQLRAAGFKFVFSPLRPLPSKPIPVTPRFSKVAVYVTPPLCATGGSDIDPDQRFQGGARC